MIPLVTPHSSADPKSYENSVQQSVPAVVAAVLCWLLMAMGFLGLHTLLQQRPQFVGESTVASRVFLVQESPQLVTRRQSDDVSVVIAAEPLRSEIEFQMRGRRDHRGLRTLSDMSGTVRARYVVTNRFEEPLFVLMRIPHPAMQGGEDSGSFVSGLRLIAQPEGQQEQGKHGWFWSGRLGPGEGATVEVDYQASALRGLHYRLLAPQGVPGGPVRVTFRRQDLTSAQFESGDGRIESGSDEVVWERNGFLVADGFTARIVESRSLFDSLSQLLEMGPILGLLFLGTVMAVILGRQRMTSLQVVTLAAGYALYFPLVLYLSSRFSFPVALVTSGLVPGVLLVNYSRWLLGPVAGLVGGPVVLLLFQVFPTLAAFAGWNRGMVLLCLGVVTLAVLIQLQNRGLRPLKASVAAAILLGFTLGPVPRAKAATGVQVILPGEMASSLLTDASPTRSPLAFPRPAQYTVRTDGDRLIVVAVLELMVPAPAASPERLFASPVHWQSWKFEGQDSASAVLVAGTNGLGVWAQTPGPGRLTLEYRVPVESRDGRWWATVPLVPGVPGTLRVETPAEDVVAVGGVVWGRVREGERETTEVGVAGEPTLMLNGSRLGGPDASGSPARGDTSLGVYGIGLPRADHLTVLNSDGSCTHFAEYEFPAARNDAFRVRLPAEARLISLSMNGTETPAPAVEEGWCRIELKVRDPRQGPQRVSLRLAYPSQHLGFMGTLDLALPEVQQTAGVMEWVVALPNGYASQVISSGMEAQTITPDLARFGDYGQVLKSHPQVYLAKNLAPPGSVRLSLRYRQRVGGVFEPSPDSKLGGGTASASRGRRDEG
ncbi:MAG: hypothetical protein JNK85_03535 [Verrucomicrobiales bacterium]|nr:hypothetical protein [Verrucomicrobiales bacterium]